MVLREIIIDLAHAIQGVDVVWLVKSSRVDWPGQARKFNDMTMSKTEN